MSDEHTPIQWLSDICHPKNADFLSRESAFLEITCRRTVTAGSSSLPPTASALTPLETADGTVFDADDAVAMARVAAPVATSDAFASSYEASGVAFASSVSIIGYADGHDGGWAG